LFSAHHSCQEISLKTGVISLSGGSMANSITFFILLSFHPARQEESIQFIPEFIPEFLDVLIPISAF